MGKVVFAILLTVLSARSAWSFPQATAVDDSTVKPAVTQDDVRIVQRAREILNSAAVWNRADTRKCPPDAKTFSLYCALEKATLEVDGKFAHRGAAMQEARFAIDDIAPRAKSYEHRLMGYNNDPATSFEDIQNFLKVLDDRVRKRLVNGGK